MSRNQVITKVQVRSKLDAVTERFADFLKDWCNWSVTPLVSVGISNDIQFVSDNIRKGIKLHINHPDKRESMLVLEVHNVGDDDQYWVVVYLEHESMGESEGLVARTVENFYSSKEAMVAFMERYVSGNPSKASTIKATPIPQV